MQGKIGVEMVVEMGLILASLMGMERGRPRPHFKNAIKREQSHACMSYAEREG